MLSNIIFSLDRVMPYFLLIILGVALRASGLVPREFFSGANNFTFRVALPIQLFYNIANLERSAGTVGPFLLYVFAVTVISFAVIWAVTEVFFPNQKPIIGTLVQGAFRGNFLLLGVPLAGAVLGPPVTGLAALTTLALIPTDNTLAVIVLSLRGKGAAKQSPGSVLLAILRNPLIIGILCAVPFWLFGIKLPQIVQTTLNHVGSMASPLGLLSIGGLLNLSDATARLRPAVYSVIIKTVILPLAIMIPSYYLGFRNEELLVLLILSATPVAISSYAMASGMGGDGPLASNILILSTFVSGFTLALGIYILRTLALI